MHGQVAMVQALLEGVDLPASKDDLIRYARRHDPSAATLLERLPDREYGRIDEVGEELAPVQPRPSEDAPPPRPESGRPPAARTT